MIRTCMLFAFALTLFPLSVSAQTVEFSEAMRIFSQNCKTDIQRHCRVENFGAGDIDSCLEKHSSRISQQCSAAKADVEKLMEARFIAIEAVPVACRRAARQYCRGTSMDSGHALKCLLKAQRVVDKQCNAAIDLAKYR